MVETRRSLLKKLAIGAIGFWSGSKRALASYFSENSQPTKGAATFYIATNGNDSNPGTASAPFATLAKARDAVRKKVASGLTDNVRVLIRGGERSGDPAQVAPQLILGDDVQRRAVALGQRVGVAAFDVEATAASRQRVVDPRHGGHGYVCLCSLR